MSMTDDAPESLTTAEVAVLQDQLANSQTAISVLVRRLGAATGGRVFIPEEELESIVGHGLKMEFRQDGILFTLTPPRVEIEATTLALLAAQAVTRGLH